LKSLNKHVNPSIEGSMWLDPHALNLRDSGCKSWLRDRASYREFVFFSS